MHSSCKKRRKKNELETVAMEDIDVENRNSINNDERRSSIKNENMQMETEPAMKLDKSSERKRPQNPYITPNPVAATQARSTKATSYRATEGNINPYSPPQSTPAQPKEITCSNADEPSPKYYNINNK